MTNAGVFFDAATLDGWLQEDIGYFDLTSTVLGIGGQNARMAWVAREHMVVACTEEVARLARHGGAQVSVCVPSGQAVTPGTVLVEADGPAQPLLDSWKVSQNLLEYACGVATRTRAMVEAAAQASQHVGILTTRKHPPGLRRMAQKAALAGGASPHRLGLSETVLVFPQHRALMPRGWDAVHDALARHRSRLIEKKVVIEAETLDEARAAVRAGADVIQFDKVEPERLAQCCAALRRQWPAIGLLAAGGIRLDNVARYAATGVDALVTSSLYFGPPADVGVQVAPA